MRYYAGIGSRETPPEVCASMTKLARYLAVRDWSLRSGGANGADSAFEAGAEFTITHGDIYLPWSGYNQRFPGGPFTVAGDWWWARDIAYKLYRGLNRRPEAVRRLMTRNVAIILGGDENGPGVPSEFVACWTPEAKLKGGTAMGIKVARAYDIPVYNFAEQREKELLWDRVKY